MSAIAPVPVSSPRRAPSAVGGPIIVASDGSAVSHEALFNAARLASSAFGGFIEVLGVCEPVPGVAAGMDVLPVPAVLDEERRANLLATCGGR